MPKPLTPLPDRDVTVFHVTIRVESLDTQVQYAFAIPNLSGEGWAFRPRVEIYRTIRAELEHLAPDLANALAAALVP